MLIEHVFNQKVYPGAGDVDDCVPTSMIQAYATQPAHKPLPTIPQFRAAAGVPDKPGPTGLTIAQAAIGARKLWSETPIVAQAFTWADFTARAYANGGRTPISLSLDSGALPVALRYGFDGLHQVTVWYEGGKWWIANPLQANGSAPRTISSSALHKAGGAFAGDGKMYAVIFPRVPLATLPPTPTDAEKIAALTAANAKLTSENADLRAKLSQAITLAEQITNL